MARVKPQAGTCGLLAQMENAGSLPDRRLDIYRRTVDLLVSRRSLGEEHDLTLAEVAPQLQFLAYKMRREGRQRIRHDEALAAFAESREVIVDIPELRRRKPEALLSAVEDSGLLVQTGVETRHGIDRPVYQFVHQSFQEYFAGQAIRYGTLPEPVISHDVRERLTRLMETLEVKERPVNLFGRKVSEKVLAEYWQESLRFCIADLGEQEADEVFLLILPGESTDPGETRARAGFAAACLAEEPRVGEATVDTVVEALLDHAEWGMDGGTSDRRTSFDQAVHALGGSKYGDRLRRRLIDGVMRRRGRARGVACLLYLHARSAEQEFELDEEDAFTEALETLGHDDPPRRVIAALGLLDAFYKAGGRFADRPSEKVQAWVGALLERLDDDVEAASFCALWALIWLTGSKFDDPAGKVRLTEKKLEPIFAFLRRDDRDPVAIRYACQLMASVENLPPPKDWLYEWSRIAQGERSWGHRTEVPKADPDESTAVLLEVLHGSAAAESKEEAALALARRGLHSEDGVDYLVGAHRDEARTVGSRAEALMHVAIAGGAHAADVLVELFRERLEWGNDSFTLVLFLSLIGLGNREVLADVEKSLADSDQSEPYLETLRRLNGSEAPGARASKSSINWKSIARQEDLPLVERYLASSDLWSLWEVNAINSDTSRHAWYYICIPKGGILRSKNPWM